MTPLTRWILYGCSAVALVSGVVLLMRDAPEDDPVAATPVSGAEEAPVAPSLVLSGPEPGTPRLGVVQDPRIAESDRRGDGIRDVLSKLENAPVYVEGVDGPSTDAPKIRRIDLTPPTDPAPRRR